MPNNSKVSAKIYAFGVYTLCLQLVSLVSRLEELEGVRQQQEGTIIAKQEENTAASSQIKVSLCSYSSLMKIYKKSCEIWHWICEW